MSADKPTKIENGVFVKVKATGKEGSVGDVREEAGVKKFLVRVHNKDERKIDESWHKESELVAIPQPGTKPA